MDGGLIITIVVLFVLFMALGSGGNLTIQEQQNLQNSRKDKQEQYIKMKGISVSKEYIYEYQEGLLSKEIRFIIDDVNKNIYLAETSDIFKRISYNDIMGCEIITDGKVSGSIKRAVVGGVLAGGVGAIVGTMTAKEHIMSYKLVLYINDVIEPRKEIVLISTKKSKKNIECINAMNFAENIVATIKVIVGQ